MMDRISLGLAAETNDIVTENVTARAIGSGSVEVYGTPGMIALMEAAAVSCIDPLLPPGYASVGIQITVDHVSATPVGEEVRAQAEVTDIDGKRVTFAVRAWDENDLIGEGTHIRYVINVEQFMQRTKR